MTKYQIALLGSSNATDKIETLKNTLKELTAELGVSSNCISFLEESDIQTRDRKAPTVGAYFGLEKNPVISNGLKDLVNSAVMVVPVVNDLGHFTEYMPEHLRPLNGAQVNQKDPAFQNIAVVLLEGLNLLRRSRRLFISYKRTETRGVAIQLYELLDKNGFDVFLDSHSIRPGEPFQEILWHRLADTDVMLLLDSPQFLKSRWTVEELTRANQSSIQVLQVIWPNSSQGLIAAFNRPFALSEDDFVDASCLLGQDAKLSEDCLGRIAAEVESIRARALAARQSRLTQEFCAQAQSFGLCPALQPSGVVSLETSSGKPVLIIPTVGIPDAVRYHDLELEVANPKYTEIVLLYDERGIRDKWLTHIDWLDLHPTKLKSLKITNASGWIRGLK